MVLTDNLLSPSSLTFARYVGGQISAPLSQSGIQVLASFTPGTEDSNAWMDYLTYQAPQNLVYTSGQMPIQGLPVNVRRSSGERRVRARWKRSNGVWDVTDPLDVARVLTTLMDGHHMARSPWGRASRYTAFKWNAVKRPVVLGPVPNSNVHGVGEVDYVIVTVPSLLPAADSLASLHASQGLRVAVVPQQDVFDAFSSGVADPTAIKMLMMMLTDRATQSQGSISAPRYLLLMGDASYENRNVQGNGNTVVGHYSLESLQTTTSYISDDYFALIAEGQGERPEDLLQLGVGRIPAVDLDAAMAVVGKVATYMGVDEEVVDVASCLDPNGSSTYGPWRNRVLFVSDDQTATTKTVTVTWRTARNTATPCGPSTTSTTWWCHPDAYVQTNTPGERYEDATAKLPVA